MKHKVIHIYNFHDALISVNVLDASWMGNMGIILENLAIAIAEI